MWRKGREKERGEGGRDRKRGGGGVEGGRDRGESGQCVVGTGGRHRALVSSLPVPASLPLLFEVGGVCGGRTCYLFLFSACLCGCSFP